MAAEDRYVNPGHTDPPLPARVPHGENLECMLKVDRIVGRELVVCEGGMQCSERGTLKGCVLEFVTSPRRSTSTPASPNHEHTGCLSDTTLNSCMHAMRVQIWPLHWWPGCDGAEGERFNTLTGRLAVSMRTFPAFSGGGKISVEVRVWDATYSTGCDSLLPAMAGNYSESI